MTQGRSIRLFLVDGKPSGLVTAEIINWTGHVLSGPRSKLSELINRPECNRTGIYFLFGPNQENVFTPFAYIGESDDVATRLKQHNRPEESGGKDFWDKVCLITSKDHNLTKAHVKYLESRLISLAVESKSYSLTNTTFPEFGNMPESDIADMGYFIEQIKIILPVLGFNLLVDSKIAPAKAQPKIESADNPIFTIQMSKYNLNAVATEIDGDFIVLANSQARQMSQKGSNHSSYKLLHEKLIDDGVLVPAQNGLLEFKTDYIFSSPSAAAAIVTGRNANGRREWRIQNTKITYDQWQNEQLNNVELVG